MEGLLSWRQALMSAGKVGFHSAIQPTNQKKKLQEQYETSKIQQTASWSGWVRGPLVSVSVCVCPRSYVCVCVDLSATFLRLTALTSRVCQETGEGWGAHAQLLTHHHWLSGFLGQGRKYVSSGSFCTCCGEKAKEMEVNSCVPERPRTRIRVQMPSSEAASYHRFHTIRWGNKKMSQESRLFSQRNKIDCK